MRKRVPAALATCSRTGSIERHVGKNALHQWLLDVIAEYLTITAMVHGFRRGLNASVRPTRWRDRTVSAEKYIHDRFDAFTGITDQMTDGTINSTSDEALDLLPSLSFSRWKEPISASL